MHNLVGEEHMKEIVLIAMRLWQRRNDFIFNSNFSHQIWWCSNQNSIDFKEAQTDFVKPATGGENLMNRWKPPTGKLFKINWDAALNKSLGKVVVGNIVKDGEGNVLATTKRMQRLRNLIFSIINCWLKFLVLFKSQFLIMSWA